MPLPTTPLAICGTLQRALEAVAPPELEERRLVLSRLDLIMAMAAKDDIAGLSAWWDDSSRATWRSLLQARSFDGSTVMHQAVDSNSVHTINSSWRMEPTCRCGATMGALHSGCREVSQR